LRAAAVQLNSTADRERNIETAERLVREAAADGAALIVLPEKFNVLGDEAVMREAGEPLNGRTAAWAAALARELSVDLVAGSFCESRAGHDRNGNTSVHFSPDGETRGVYRKIHMFDVEVGGVEYRESATEEAGDEIVISELADGTRLGLTVCYDLRFPELYRILALQGARVISVPAAFTKITGEAHWEVLIRARAIENQCFVVAADQFGPITPDTETFGGSMIVDPWGRVLARAGDGECFIAADLDLAEQLETRRRLPSLANRVESAYRWPAVKLAGAHA
jgi:predicted amidohydrolase